MLTVNLEKKLSRQPVSKVKASELLLIKEYDRLGEDVANSEILDRIGVNKSVIEGRKLTALKNSYLDQAQMFNLDKVYHISQIENICKKYRLRFLTSALFKGSVDPCLVDKISTFEITYGVKCESKVYQRSWDWERIEANNNTFIAAPASSFALQEKPKDPLFFYKINEEYYYLIHKWGNDISLFRQLGNLLEKKMFLWVPVILCFLLALSKVKIQGNYMQPESQGYIVIITAILIYSLFSLVIGEGGFRLLKKNDITSRFL